ncbi:NAD(P)-dependent oxidoreductase [Salarchaeum sp. JOR-1]|uniref:NAD-dependent epimerase/dehydratase family protein n=1 Tax=Salarchaeum sp. JOR-1 TaxID=2599399 RepID=UPI001198CA20|nr:NAD-dependent epimerase/dehydratase family protein [Salarchaeum sp. JOR-1]QDX41026.1 NAD-dependent epimerase/dehydratase family protein [Salarchaeum sp. JOR-1]
MGRVLVTGSSGFIGSNLCQELVRRGHEVHGVDIDPPEFDLPESVNTFQADLTNEPELPDLDVIVHLAAHSQVQPVVADPSLALENVKMTQHVLNEAERMDAAVINASSRDVYGAEIQPTEDEVTPDSPNGYAASKLSSEAFVNAYRHTRDVSVTSLRLANVYGPRDLNPRVIPIFIALADAGEDLTVYGEGKLLDFVHVGDVCEAFCAAINRIEAVNGEIFNIGSGRGVQLSDIAETITTAVDSDSTWMISNDRKGDVERYVADTSKTEAALDIRMDTELDKGLANTIEWYRSQPEVLSTLRSE